MFKEETICKLQQGKTKLHLLKLTASYDDIIYGCEVQEIEYQVRLNRKRIDKDKSEYKMRKLFASIAINIVTQLNINGL